MTEHTLLADQPPFIEVHAAGGRVKYIHLIYHPDGTIKASALVEAFTRTRFHWHLYARFGSRTPRPEDITHLDDGRTWYADIAGAGR